MTQAQVTTFLQNQERYDIGFKRIGVTEYGSFYKKDLASSVNHHRDPLSDNTDIDETDLSNSQTEFYINDTETSNEIFSSPDYNAFNAKIRELSDTYSRTLKKGDH